MTTPTPTPTSTPATALVTHAPPPMQVGVAPAVKVVVPVTAEQHAVIKAQPGQQYKMVRAQDGKPELVPSTLEVAGDNVIAIRQGDDLLLRYENGTTATIEGFYSVCTDASVCSVELPAKAGQSIVLSGDAAPGVAVGEGGTLVYAHGSQDTLLAMAQSDSELTTALTNYSGFSGEAASIVPSAAASVAATGAAASSGIGPMGLLGIVGGGVALAAGGGGSSPAATPEPVVPTTTISGSIVAGPVILGNQLSVSAFRADGTSLLAAGGLVDANGNYTLTFQSNYVGAVLVKVNADADTIADYMDEATGAGKDLSDSIFAVAYVATAGTAMTVNITPLTDLAVTQLGRTDNAISGASTAAAVATANNDVAKFFGLTSGAEEIISFTAIPVVDASGKAQTSNAYGNALASISGAELQSSKSTAEVVAILSAGIDFSGTTAAYTANAQGEAARVLLQGGVSNTLQSGVITVDEAVTLLSHISSQSSQATGQPLSALTDAEITALTPAEVAALTSISSAHLALLSAAQLTGFGATQVATLIGNQITSLSSAAIAGLSAVAIGSLSSAQIGALSVAQAGALTGSQISAFSTAQLKEFDPNIVASLSATAVANLTADQVAALTVNQVDALTLNQLAALTATQIVALTKDQVAALNPDSVAGLSAGALAALTVDQLGALTAPQAAKLTGTQIDALSTTQVAALGLDAVAGLGVAALSSLNEAQIGALTKLQAAKLTDTQIDTLTTTQVAALKPFALAGLTDAALLSIDAAQFSALTETQIGALSAPQRSTLSPVAINVISAAAGNSTTPPALTTYTVAGVTGVTSSNLAGLNSVLSGGLNAAATDTASEIQAVVDAYNVVQAGAAAGTAPTQAQLQTLGVTGITSGNLSAIQAAIAASADDGTGLDTMAELQNLVVIANLVVTAMADGVTLGTASTNLTTAETALAALLSTASSQTHAVTSAELTDIQTAQTTVASAKALVVSGTTAANAAVSAANTAATAAAQTAPDLSSVATALTAGADALASLVTDSAAPTFSSVVLSATGDSNSTLNSGDTAHVTLSLSEAVYVTGSPQLTLVIGSTEVLATYNAALSSSTHMVFDYTVLFAESDSNGIAIKANSLSLNGGSITDLAANAAALTHAGAADNASFMINNSGPSLSIDDVAGNNQVNATEKTNSVLVSGKTSAEDTVNDSPLVTVVWGGKTLTAAITGGTWSAKFLSADIPADASASTITASVSNLAGNQTQAARSVLIDTVQPTLTFAATLTDGAGTAGNADNILNAAELLAIPDGGSWEVRGSSIGAQDGQAVSVTLNGTTYSGSVSANIWSVNVAKADVQALVHGSDYTLKAAVSDAAGNAATAAVASLQVRLATPDTPTITALNTNSLTPTLGGSIQKENVIGSGNYIALGNADSFTVTVNGQIYSLTVGSTGSSTSTAANGSLLTYTTSSKAWSLALDGTAITTAGAYDVDVSVVAVGYSTAKADISKNELVIKTALPVVTINTVTADNVLNALEHSASAVLSGTATDKAEGGPNNTAVGRNLTVTLNSQTYSATVQADGSWSTLVSAAHVAALIDGSHTASASYASVYGSNTGSVNKTFVVETAAPTLSLTPPSDVLLSATESASFSMAYTTSDASGTPVVSAQVLNNLGVEQNGVNLVASSTNVNGSLTNLADGVYTIQVSSTDTAGNVTRKTQVVTVDQTIAVPTLALATDSGDSSTDKITNIGTLNVAGLESGGTWEYSLNNGSSWSTTGTTTTDTTGTISITGDGDKSVTVRQTDAAGNTATSSAFAFILNAAAPTVAITDNASGTLNIADATITYTFTFNEAVTGFDAADITVTNGSKGTFSGSGKVYTLVVTPTAGLVGNVLLSVPAAVVDTVIATDTAGNNMTLATTATAQAVDLRAPTVSGVVLSSATGVSNLTLSVGDTVFVTATMSEATFVIGSPTVALKIGTETLHASYVSGSSTTALVFGYTILAGETDATGISIDAGSVVLNGATLKDAAGNNATLSYALVADNANYKVDTTAPVVSSVALTSAPNALNSTLNAGDTAFVTVAMSEVTNVTGVPTLGLMVGSTAVTATYVSGSGTAALVFSYIILAGQTDANGISIPAGSVALNGGTLQDPAGNDAKLSYALVADNASYKVDTTAPTSSMSAQTLNSTTNAVVQSTEVGAAYLVKDTVAVTNLASINAAEDTSWNTATIATAITNTDLALTGLVDGSYTLYTADAAGNLSAGSSTKVLIDNIAPVVSSMAISATGIQNNTLNVGDVVSITVTMSDATFVTGAPTLALKIGSTAVNALYASGSGTAALVYNYTIAAGQTDTNGISIDAGSIGTTSATLQDAAGNNAVLTYPAVTDNSSYKVDTIAPTNTMAAQIFTTVIDTSDVVVQSSEIGTAYLVKDSTNMTSGLAALTLANETSWNTAAITAAGTDTNLFLSGLVDGSYTLYTADEAGNLSGASANKVVLDTTAPTLTITDNNSGTASFRSSVLYTFKFTEAVTGFDATDVTISAGTKGTFTKVSNSEYTLDVSLPSDIKGGTNILNTSVAAGAVMDVVGNVNTTSAENFQNYQGMPYNVIFGTWNFISPVALSNGKVYYFLDYNNDSSAKSGVSDMITIGNVRGVFNSNSATADTQPSGAVKGVDDARTFNNNGYTFVLPTVTEWQTFYNDSPSNRAPSDWLVNTLIFSSTVSSNGNNYAVALSESPMRTFDQTGNFYQGTSAILAVQIL